MGKRGKLGETLKPSLEVKILRIWLLKMGETSEIEDSTQKSGHVVWGSRSFSVKTWQFGRQRSNKSLM